MTGTVKFFSRMKNFGFITAENGTEYFTHQDDVSGDLLNKGDSVEFEIGQDRKNRTKATNVKKMTAGMETAPEVEADASQGELEEKILQALAQDVSAGEPGE